MKPTNNSILVDMDGTLFNFVDVFNKRLYPHNISNNLTQYDILGTQLEQSIVKAHSTIDAIFSASFYADESPHTKMITYVQNLINQFDVWFVTAPISSYHRECCVNEKRAQIQRFYGWKAAQKIIYTSEKHKVLGLYLIDDHPNIVEIQAGWKPIMVSQVWNANIHCDIRIDLRNPQVDGL
ncbi:5'-3'_deoxyribonucleotidase [Hexamita inflata]|uniref:5'-3' deoxyribonucleotidase n=1 Tax=Hexamita inflata TaxID=28002 RepID=A0AA86V5M0_9EUKA|nr:5'-3' deoxyribonucleotidase [Hexamita inflata]